MKFTILHTNDIHSRFENFAKLSTKIKELRDENTIVLDAGDFNDFMRLELQGTMGRAGSELLSIAGYDAITLGNNEGFAGVEIAEVLATTGDVQYLSCNLYKFTNKDKNIDDGNLTKLYGVESSIIIERGGVRFLVIGSSPYGTYNEFYNLSGLHTTDAIKEISYVLMLNRGKFDVCILLSHCGMKEDTEIANTLTEIDFIINGHSHILMEKEAYINNTVIHMSGCYGENLGVVTFDYDGHISNTSGVNVNVDSIEPDMNILFSLKASREKAVSKLSEPLYEIEESLWHDVVEENPITNLLADSLRTMYNCQLGIINSGVLNGGIKKGAVTKKKLLEICPSPLNPTIMKLRGKDIRKAITESVEADFCMQDGKGAGFRGKYLGRLHISGGYIKYDGRKIVDIIIGNESISDFKWYTVATSDYLQRGTGYTSLANNQSPDYSADYLRDTLEKYLQKEDFIHNSLVDRWRRV